MKGIFFTLASLCLTHVAALNSTFFNSNNSTQAGQSRPGGTCGDLSAATTFYKGFHAAHKVHTMNTQAAFVYSMTVGDGWQSTIPSFRGWLSAGQPGTVPFYYTQAPVTSDVTFSLTKSPNAGIVGYVYPTQICNSVPLYGAAQLSAADHWYTTIRSEVDELVSRYGWTDIGIVAYVVPLDDCTCSY